MKQLYRKKRHGIVLFQITLCMAVLVGTFTACAQTSAGDTLGGSSAGSEGLPQGVSSCGSQIDDTSSFESRTEQSSAPISASSPTRSSRAEIASRAGSGKTAGTQDDGGWTLTSKDQGSVVDLTNKNGMKKEIVLGEAAFTPCLAGNWVYYFQDLNEIWKVKVDGSQKMKVCSTDAMGYISGSYLFTAEYKNGSILYKKIQMKQAGDTASVPAPSYYKLDLNQNKITPLS